MRSARSSKIPLEWWCNRVAAPVAPMSNPFDSASRSCDDRSGIAPAAEIRAYLARHGGPSEPAQAVTPAAAEPTPAAASEVVSDVKAEPERTVVEPAPVVRGPAPVVMEDAATELPVVDATHASTSVQVEPAAPSAAQSVGIQASEPEPIALEPKPTPTEPEPISPESAPVVNAVSEPSVPDAAPAPTIAPPQVAASPPSANSNNIDVVSERVTNTATAREAPPPPPGKPTQARSNIPLYLLGLTIALALDAHCRGCEGNAACRV
jgi:hypothetical protein